MKHKLHNSKLLRDISWLAFNARVLQEAKDPNVHVAERLRFLGIFSNNLDEFFRVRVATLNRMLKFGKETKRFLEEKPQTILKQIQENVILQQREFEQIYADIVRDLKKQKIALVNEKQLSKSLKTYVENYFNDKVRTHIAPLMIESIPELPLLRDKSIYLACLLSNSDNSFMNSYALIEVPTETLPRFVILPTEKGIRSIMLLEDIIRLCMPGLFAQFGFNSFEGYIIKVTRDAELDIDNDINTDLISSIEKGLKNRKRGKAVRLVYDKSIQKNLLNYLTKLLSLGNKDHLVPGGRIHNFKDFMDFPKEVFEKRKPRNQPFIHPLLKQPVRILDVLQKQDVMLHFPYHSFDSVIDLLREVAIDPFVESIKITCYRLARESKVVNALVNAVRNGKKVTVVLELKARFDEEANLRWKRILEDEGIHVIPGLPERKIHAKICLIAKRNGKNLQYYGFVSTGNLNEQTAKVYGDHCLLTANKVIVSDIRQVFNYIEKQEQPELIKRCKSLIVSPFTTRSFFVDKIRHEVKNHLAGKPAGIIIKLNSLTDEVLIEEIYAAAKVGLDCKLIIRGICCALTTHEKWKKNIQAISIVDEYLEHARVFFFVNGGKEDLYISSADWMTRNLDYRIEVSTIINDPNIKEELKHILQIQLNENVKARVLDNRQLNEYVKPDKDALAIRSQVEIYAYLKS
ncbi:MAG: polyphosphate kinase 1 [Bacteroidetes bacterium]|nr:polyphosphate kinase 1 [Bacteroidota bacterium]